MCDNDDFWSDAEGMSGHTKQTLFAYGFGRIAENKERHALIGWKRNETPCWNLSECHRNTILNDDILSALSSYRLVA